MKKILKKILLICVITFFFFASIPYVYTSPVFTKSNIKLFNDAVELFTDNILIDCIMPWEISTIDNFYFLDNNKLQKDFSQVEIDKIIKVIDGFEDSEFYKIERSDGFLLFHTSTFFYSSVKYGACYSMNGENPNEISDINIQKYSPYIKMKDNWYISRWLAPKARLPFNPDLPDSSLIDHSTKIPED